MEGFPGVPGQLDHLLQKKLEDHLYQVPSVLLPRQYEVVTLKLEKLLFFYKSVDCLGHAIIPVKI